MSTFVDPEAQEREAQRQEFKRIVAENPQVALSCTCGWSWEGPSGAVEWITDRHTHAHNKGDWVPGKEGQQRLLATGEMCARPAGPAVQQEAER